MTEAPPDETRMTAHLPAMRLELRHARRAGAEMVAVAITAEPNFLSLASRSPEAPALWWWQWWTEAVLAAWSPWLTGPADRR